MSSNKRFLIFFLSLIVFQVVLVRLALIVDNLRISLLNFLLPLVVIIYTLPLQILMRMAEPVAGISRANPVQSSLPLEVALLPLIVTYAAILSFAVLKVRRLTI